MSFSDNIDFVVTWVDDTDSDWRKKKEKFTGTKSDDGNTEVRYRDWDTLKYWFRGVEKFAPWVRNIYFVTDNQKPEWLNAEHPKLKLINHTDYIPKEYLPTFNSHTIEWNIHNIKNLSDNFVYFNDDVFLINRVAPEDFFVNGLPCDLPVLGPLYPDGFFSRILFNNTELLNNHFSLKKSIRNNLRKWVKCQPISGLLKLLLYGKRDLIPYSVSHHIHTSFNKNSFLTLWEKEYTKIDSTCKNKLRTTDDVSPYCVRDWQLFSGNFHPKKPIGKAFHTATMDYSDEAINYLKKQKGKVICLNDSENETNFEEHKKLIVEAFEKLFPEKSSFEL